MHTHPAYFERQHERLDALLHAHLLDIVGGDFNAALERLRRWRQELAQHIEIENTRLLPHVPEGARWTARAISSTPARFHPAGRTRTRAQRSAQRKGGAWATARA